jgi:hypothetical protein
MSDSPKPNPRLKLYSIAVTQDSDIQHVEFTVENERVDRNLKPPADEREGNPRIAFVIWAVKIQRDKGATRFRRSKNLRMGADLQSMPPTNRVAEQVYYWHPEYAAAGAYSREDSLFHISGYMQYN